MIKVYIASAYTIGNTAANVARQMRVANQLIRLGFAPYVPLLNHFQDIYYKQDEETWMQLDFVWVKSCHCVLRLGGESPGADREVELAKENNIPVFYSMDELMVYWLKED